MSTLSQISYIYHPRSWNKDIIEVMDLLNNPGTKRRVSKNVPATHNSSHTLEQRPTPFRKRDVKLSYSWKLSQISTPKSFNWLTDRNIQRQILVEGVETTEYKYYFHSSEGFGQYIYFVEDGIWPGHQVNRTSHCQSLNS